jgi:hypothetical protein
MRQAYIKGTADDPLLRSVRDSSADGGYAVFSDGSPREIISRESHALADATDRSLERALPAKYISDPAYIFTETEPELDLYTTLAGKQEAHEEMVRTLSPLMRNFGAHTRSFVLSLPVDAR